MSAKSGNRGRLPLLLAKPVSRAEQMTTRGYPFRSGERDLSVADATARESSHGVYEAFDFIGGRVGGTARANQAIVLVAEDPRHGRRAEVPVGHPHPDLRELGCDCS